MNSCHVAFGQERLQVPDRWIAVQQTFAHCSVTHVYKPLHYKVCILCKRNKLTDKYQYSRPTYVQRVLQVTVIITSNALIHCRSQWPCRWKAWLFGRQLGGIAGSNPSGSIDDCLLWVLCVVRQRFLRRTDHSSRGTLPSVMRLIVIVKPRQWEGQFAIHTTLQNSHKYNILYKETDYYNHRFHHAVCADLAQLTWQSQTSMTKAQCVHLIRAP
jgi:hypothetical protein